MYSLHTYMQVVWLGRPVAESSWEPASSLPTTLIKEFDDGIQREIEEHSYTSGGQTICTLSSSQKDAEPEPKKVCLRCSIESSNSG